VAPQDKVPQDNPISTKPATKTASTTSKKATVKMTGKTGADYWLTVSPGCLVSKLYGFGTDNKYAVLFNMEGMTDYCLVRHPPQEEWVHRDAVRGWAYHQVEPSC
jgi:hypothetical protein